LYLFDPGVSEGCGEEKRKGDLVHLQSSSGKRMIRKQMSAMPERPRENRNGEEFAGKT
jgi:hypothetical protein